MENEEITDNIDDEIEDDEETDNKNSIINDLFSGIDLPGDKERISTKNDYKNEQALENIESTEIDEDDNRFYDPAPLVEYNRPELKTDKKRHITTNDLNKLFSDYDRTIAGGKPDNQEPIFGKDIEPEKKIADLPELQNQKLFNEKPYDSLVDEELSPNMGQEEPESTQNIEEDNIISDFDEKFDETPIDIPKKDFSDIASEEDEQKTSTDFDDMDDLIEEIDKVEDKNNIEDEDTESEFSDLIAINSDKENDKKSTTTLDELEGAVKPLKNEFDLIPKIEEIEELIESQEESPTVEPTTEEDIQKEEPSLVEELIEEPSLVEEPIKDIPELDDKSLESSSFDLKDNLNLSDISAEKQTIEKELIEEPQKEKVIDLQDEITNDKELYFTDKEIETIQKNLQSLASPISDIATDVIVNEKLEVPMLNSLTALLLEPKPNIDKIKTFIEDNVGISIKDKYPTKIQKEPKPSTSNKAFITIAALVIIAVGTLLYYLLLDHRTAKTENYEIGLGHIHTAIPNYSYAEQKFNQAKKASNKKDINWYNKYAEEYIIRGDEKAIELAEKKLIEAEKIDPKNKDTRSLFAKLYTQKAQILAYNNKNGVNRSFELAFSKGFNHIEENDNTLDQKARTYITFGDILLKKNKETDAKEQYNKAENIYKKISSSNKDSLLALYGSLRLSLRPNKSNPDDIYNSIKNHDISDADEVAITEYATDLLNRNRQDKALDVLKIVINKDKPYPEAYYALGRLYKQKPVDINKSLKSYQKGLLAYYINYFFDASHKSFADLNKGKTPQDQAESFKNNMSKAITLIKYDMNPINNVVQAKIFNDIGENYLYKSNDLSNRIPREKEYKKDLISVAKKNFYFSISKENKNYKPLENLGNLSYSEAINSPKPQPDAETVEEGLKTIYQKPKKYYFYAINLMTNKGKPNNDNINDLLIKEAGSNKVSPTLYYRMGYIYYKEGKYKNASAVWQAVKSSDEKFNPNLNFGLANSYLKEQEYELAQMYYQNVIDSFKSLANKYESNPDPSNPIQKKVYARLASAHNNIGVSHHMRAEKYNNSKFKDDALYHYQMAHQYYSKLDHKAYLHAKAWNTKLLNWVQNRSITLKQRNTSIDRMLLGRVEPYLNSD